MTTNKQKKTTNRVRSILKPPVSTETGLGQRDEHQFTENGKTQVKTFNELEEIPDKIKLNFLKTPQNPF